MKALGIIAAIFIIGFALLILAGTLGFITWTGTLFIDVFAGVVGIFGGIVGIFGSIIGMVGSIIGGIFGIFGFFIGIGLKIIFSIIVIGLVIFLIWKMGRDKDNRA